MQSNIHVVTHLCEKQSAKCKERFIYKGSFTHISAASAQSVSVNEKEYSYFKLG